MPVWTVGKEIKQAEWDRLIQSIPASYVLWKDGTTYRAECLLKGGTDYSDTDFATVIESAMGALPNGGKLMLKGQQTTNSQIDIPYNNIMLQGEGIGSKIIGNVSGTDDIIQASGKDGTIIDNLYIQGQSGVGRNGISLLGCDDSVVSRCYVKNTYRRGIAVIEPAGGTRNAIINNICYTSGYGSPAADSETIVCGGLYKSVVMGNRVYGSWQGGITLSVCSDSIVCNNVIEDSDGQNMGYGGIDFEDTSRSIIANNTIEGTGRGIRISSNSTYNTIIGNSIKSAKMGIFISKTAAASPYNAIQNNFIYPLTEEGIAIQDTCTDCLIQGNTIMKSQVDGILTAAPRTFIQSNKIFNCDQSGAAWHGIKVGDTGYCIINNNDVYDTETTPTQDYGIYLNNASYCVLVGNRARNNGVYGILTDGTSDYNLIIGNMCAGNLHASYDIVYVGTNNKVAWNIGRYSSQGSA